jgi:DNA-binding transcriptional regulator YhcF (GntR family)
MDFRINRELSVPVRLQIKGMIEHGVAAGELLVGEPLPSVRDLAERVGVAPMTVSQVYGELKKDGLIETRPGSGTFVADCSKARMAARPDIVALHRQIDALIDSALALGIRSADVAALINARLSYRFTVGRSVSVIMVGLFTEATASYARFIAERLGGKATVEPMIIDTLQRDAAARDRAGSADLVVTFSNRHREVSNLLPNTKVVSIRFIPSEATRMALASLDPMARVVVVSRFPEFMPIIRAGVERFAAQVQDFVTTSLEDPDLTQLLRASNVVVFSTGAEAATDLANPGTQSIEYRHTPDPGDIERIVLPFVTMAAEPADSAGKEAS